MGIEKENYGVTKEGKQVTKYTLTNGQGASVSFLDYGAVIQSIIVPDKDGKLEDVVLGYDTLSGYESNVPSFGSPVGRCANRISNACFVLNGKEYPLDDNAGTNCLHGGFLRYNYLMYDAECATSQDDASVSFSRVSPDGEQGFPGNLTLTITYTWNDANELMIEYNAVSDADTILNITNHSYFNIGCGGQAAGDVLGAQVQIASAKYTPINEKRLPTGEICYVAGTAMDFREFHDIGSRIGEDDANAQTVSGYDHNYILPGNPGEICYAAAVRDPESRRIVEVFTDMPGVQLYTAKELVEQDGKGGITYGNFGGLCFETQQYPNGINEPKFPSPILKAGETFESTTVFRFGIY